MASNGFLRGGVADQVRGEVDVRIAQLISALDSTAERIAESVQEIQAEVAQDERFFRAAVGATKAGSFTTLLDLGVTALGSITVIDCISWYVAGSQGVGSFLYFNDQTDVTANVEPPIVNLAFAHDTLQTQATTVTGMHLLVPPATRLTGRVAGSRQDNCAMIVSGRQLAIQP